MPVLNLGAGMRRRDFIKAIAGSAAAWPFAAHSQQGGGKKRIGVLIPATADDPLFQARKVAFFQGLQQLGWIDGRNVRIDIRLWSTGEADEIRRYATELVALAPDVILASGSTTLGPLLRLTRSIPIVFAVVPDPVGAGFVESLARPGG